MTIFQDKNICGVRITGTTFFICSIDSETLRRHKRYTVASGSKESISLNIRAHGEHFIFEVQHTESALHPDAVVRVHKDGVRRPLIGKNPDCFMTGLLASHDQQTAVFSFCDSLVSFSFCN